jgi:hypothetical protein
MVVLVLAVAVAVVVMVVVKLSVMTWRTDIPLDSSCEDACEARGCRACLYTRCIQFPKRYPRSRIEQSNQGCPGCARAPPVILEQSPTRQEMLSRSAWIDRSIATVTY